MKSKQELIEKWESAIGAAEFYGKGKEERLISYMKDFVSDLNQLDDPEVLSQEWIEQNHFCVENWDEDLFKSDGDGLFDHTPQIKVIALQDLQNLLVPEQEKPVIPQSVADWLKERRKNGFPNIDIVEQIYSIDHMDNLEVNTADAPVKKYLNSSNENKEKIVKAVILDNYEVEEEQKYRVLDGNTTLLGRINGLILTTVEILEYYPEYDPTFEFTEQEIKDYDPRYMTFAKPVEELKE